MIWFPEPSRVDRRGVGVLWIDRLFGLATMSNQEPKP